jgi:hypothetical protein
VANLITKKGSLRLEREFGLLGGRVPGAVERLVAVTRPLAATQKQKSWLGINLKRD